MLSFTRTLVIGSAILIVAVTAGRFSKITDFFSSKPNTNTITVAPVEALYYDPYEIYTKYVFPTLAIERINGGTTNEGTTNGGTTNRAFGETGGEATEEAFESLEDINHAVKARGDFRKQCLIAMHPDHQVNRRRSFFRNHPSKTENDLWEIDIASELLALITTESDHTTAHYYELLENLASHQFFADKPQFIKRISHQALFVALGKLGLKRSASDIDIEDEYEDVEIRIQKMREKDEKERAENKANHERRLEEIRQAGIRDLEEREERRLKHEDEFFQTQVDNLYKRQKLSTQRKVICDKNEPYGGRLWRD